MSDEETVHQYSKMTLQFRKSVRDLAGDKTLVSRAAKNLGVPTLEMINYKIYTDGLEKKSVLPLTPKIKVFPSHLFLLDPSMRNAMLMDGWNQKA